MSITRKEGVPMTVKYVFEPEVTEEEWLDLEGSNPWAVWRSMPFPEGYRGLDRKRLLLVAHLVRQVVDQMTDPRFVAVIEVAEKGADGLLSEKEMWAAHERAYEVFDTVPQPHEAATDAADVAQRFLYERNETAEMMVRAAGSRAAHLAGGKGKKAEAARRQAEKAMEALTRRLINEVHGNPFRPVTFSPAWRTDTVMLLARQMYDSRDFLAMPILADALEDAGCTTPAILDHCRRDPGPHIRGCWAIDLVLEKEWHPREPDGRCHTLNVRRF
jgi:hypothetical protein